MEEKQCKIGWRDFDKSIRFALVSIYILGMVGFLTLLSWVYVFASMLRTG